jgi:hypothetical protein
VTTPPEVILALPVPDATDQVPPAVISLNGSVFEPTQTVAAPPVIGDTAGRGFTS